MITFSFFKIIICLKNLSNKHSIAILTSIHQPNCDVLRLFDQLYILSNKGECIYNNDPSKLKQHLIEYQIELLDYQVPIEEIIKIASSSHSDKLIKKQFENSTSSQELWLNDSKLLKNSLFHKNKSFNLTDVMILLRRTATNEFIGGWKIQFGFLFFYFLSLFTMICLFPNDIGTDPGCTEETIDLRNISSINQRVLDVIIGNQQKFQQNVKFIFNIIMIIYSFDLVQWCYMSSYQNEVS